MSYPTPQFDAITLTPGGTITNFPVSALPASGVTAGTYGDSTHTLTLTCDSAGLVTGLSTNLISGPGTTFTFAPQAAPTLAAGITWGDSTQYALTNYINGIQGWVPRVLWIVASLPSFTLSSTPTNILTTHGMGTLTLPANYLVVGKTLRLTVRGYLSGITTAFAPTGNLTIGGTTIAAIGNGYTTFDTTTYSMSMEYLMTCVSTGSTGSIATHLLGLTSGSGASAAQTPPMWSDSNGGATTAINTTVANTIGLTLGGGAATLNVTHSILEELA